MKAGLCSLLLSLFLFGEQLMTMQRKHYLDGKQGYSHCDYACRL